MNIPSCINLTEGQKRKFFEFVATLVPISIEEHDEQFGGFCFTNRIVFEIQETSIGFNIWARDEITGKRISLLTDEDIEAS